MLTKRERYTPNDVGPSPLDWKTPRLAQVCEFISNGFVGTASPFYADSTGVPYLYGCNVRPNKIDLKGTRYVTHAFHLKESKTALTPGDLLTVQSGHIGETAVVPDDLEIANCHALIITRLNKSLVHPPFLSQYLNSEIGKARLKGLEVGSTILHINTKDLKKFKLLLPPIEEQKKIAEILSIWDEAISTTDQLYKNLRQQKKILAGQLLNSKRRLSDFSNTWKSKPVPDCLIGSTLRNSKLSRFSIKDVMSVNKAEGMIPMRSETIGKSIERYKIVRKGWFAYNPMRINTGSICRWQKDNDCLVSPDYIVFYCNEDVLLGSYFDQFRQSERWADYMSNAGNGSVRVRIYLKDLERLEIPLPSLEEQEKIVHILETADHEIDAIKQNLVSLKVEKKALMQQLLTGKLRVKVETQ